LRVYSPAGREIVVGRNARQNEQVTFGIANADDLWLHARDVPGAHVVIRSGGQPVDDESVRLAAQLAAYYSKRRGDRAVPVAVTTRRFVARVPGGRPGQVYIRNEETVVVPGELPAGKR
jgi:predicted ribosome quality control (RQC) complex YloA/Tae2 family protein